MKKAIILFNLYKDDKTYLGDTTLYPLNNFEGNKPKKFVKVATSIEPPASKKN